MDLPGGKGGWFKLAITNVRVIDGTGAPAKERMRSSSTTRRSRPSLSGSHPCPDATVIDGTGMTLNPGLIGMHDHQYYIAHRAAEPHRRRPFAPAAARAADDVRLPSQPTSPCS